MLDCSTTPLFLAPNHSIDTECTLGEEGKGLRLGESLNAKIEIYRHFGWKVLNENLKVENSFSQTHNFQFC
jgi:hypothetical protein